MTTYFSVLVVLFGVGLLWKAVSLSGEYFISSTLCRLRAKAGMLSLKNPEKYSADREEVNAIIEWCQRLTDNFSIRKFVVFIMEKFRDRDDNRNVHMFSEPELEKIAITALWRTLTYLLMVSPSLLLIFCIFGWAMLLRDGYSATRQTLTSITRYFAECGFTPLDESQRLA